MLLSTELKTTMLLKNNIGFYSIASFIHRSSVAFLLLFQNHGVQFNHVSAAAIPDTVAWLLPPPHHTILESGTTSHQFLP